MKALPLTTIAAIVGLHLAAQQMHVKNPNLASFNSDKKIVTPLLLQRSSTMAKQHPEFGILPYNAQCSSCMELIDRRTVNSRYFIDPANPRHIYSQTSYTPLHYKASANDVWHTIDKRLRPDIAHPGVYTAPNQPLPTKCDLNRHSTAIKSGDFEFEFNHNLQMYLFDESSAYTKTEAGNYGNYTIGEEGLRVKNIWPGMDMQQVFSEGSIKTNFVINSPLNLPVKGGWMVIEDHFTLPAGYTVAEADNGAYNKDGYYSGNYEIKDPRGNTRITLNTPVYIDAKAYGMHGYYNLNSKGNDYTLQMMVPVSWLNSKDNEYPIFIDPLAYGNTSIGNYQSDSGTSANYGFTTQSLGSCNDSMFVQVPGPSTLQNAWVEFEYALTYSTSCGSPPEPAPYCTFSQITQKVMCNQCGVSSPLLSCNPANPPFTGTCTTDSNLVAGAGAINITNLAPNFISCINHTCSNYYLHFTLFNQDSICGDACGYLCAVGHYWAMTVDAVEDSGIAVYTYFSNNGDTLYSSVPTGNQWYRNDTALDGDTSALLILSQPGTYFDVIANVDGCAFDTTGSFTVYAPPPPQCYAWFQIAPANGDTGIYIGYTAISGDSLSYLWNFGDGDTSSQQWPTHTYDTAGYYNICLTVYNDSCSDTYCDSDFYAYKTGWPIKKIIIAGPLGISPVLNTPSVSIYPNPATNTISIRPSNLHPTDVVIYDVEGRKVLQQKFMPEMDVSGLGNGIYMVEITGPEGTITRRLVKF